MVAREAEERKSRCETLHHFLCSQLVSTYICSPLQDAP